MRQWKYALNPIKTLAPVRDPPKNGCNWSACRLLRSYLFQWIGALCIWWYLLKQLSTFVLFKATPQLASVTRPLMTDLPWSDFLKNVYHSLTKEKSLLYLISSILLYYKWVWLNMVKHHCFDFVFLSFFQRKWEVKLLRMHACVKLRLFSRRKYSQLFRSWAENISFLLLSLIRIQFEFDIRFKMFNYFVR